MINGMYTFATTKARLGSARPYRSFVRPLSGPRPKQASRQADLWKSCRRQVDKTPYSNQVSLSHLREREIKLSFYCFRSLILIWKRRAALTSMHQAHFRTKRWQKSFKNQTTGVCIKVREREWNKATSKRYQRSWSLFWLKIYCFI